jgi:hypothetical protein
MHAEHEILIFLYFKITNELIGRSWILKRTSCRVCHIGLHPLNLQRRSCLLTRDICSTALSRYVPIASFCLCFRAEPILPLVSMHLPTVLENLKGWVLAPISSPVHTRYLTAGNRIKEEPSRRRESTIELWLHGHIRQFRAAVLAPIQERQLCRQEFHGGLRRRHTWLCLHSCRLAPRLHSGSLR